jgi:hypothetical protein
VLQSDTFIVFIVDNNIVTCNQEAIKTSLVTDNVATHYAAVYEKPIEISRRPWQRRIEVYSPKLKRRMTLFSWDGSRCVAVARGGSRGLSLLRASSVFGRLSGAADRDKTGPVGHGVTLFLPRSDVFSSLHDRRCAVRNHAIQRSAGLWGEQSVVHGPVGSGSPR